MARLIPTDKLMHAGVGLAVAVFALACWWALSCLGLAPMSGAPAATGLASLVAGLAKEGADWIDNRTAGMPVHGVEGWDVVATAAPGTALGLLVGVLIG